MKNWILSMLMGCLATIVLLVVMWVPTQSRQQSTKTHQHHTSAPTRAPTATPSIAPPRTQKQKEIKKTSKKDKFKTISNCPWSRKTQKKIAEICKRKSVSFELIMSMAYTESRFDESARGDGGLAWGAWQIHPSVWEKVINGLGYDEADMIHVIPAAEVTAHIMRAHFERYDDVYFATMAWNGGGDYALTMIDSGRTSQYAKEIERRAMRYERR